ncbi:uncharacterized protein A4U43_C03F29490 [Asparagus officinalis]|uniref:Uncharacterized protein n=1 Tax=Asparagus officinalis TaxID=4686 RepID=A0A5P1FDU6_ASPOF|nr:uncharacterized protein A4U43_C03F29490 [Asparagus officinalis]
MSWRGVLRKGGGRGACLRRQLGSDGKRRLGPLGGDEGGVLGWAEDAAGPEASRGKAGGRSAALWLSWWRSERRRVGLVAVVEGGDGSGEEELEAKLGLRASGEVLMASGVGSELRVEGGARYCRRRVGEMKGELGVGLGRWRHGAWACSRARVGTQRERELRGAGEGRDGEEMKRETASLPTMALRFEVSAEGANVYNVAMFRGSEHQKTITTEHRNIVHMSSLSRRNFKSESHAVGRD